jgi:hypothetical protein
MGQAKQRGTFEQRKAEAIKAGRVKVRYSKSAIKKEVKSVIEDYFAKMFGKVTRFLDLIEHR